MGEKRVQMFFHLEELCEGRAHEHELAPGLNSPITVMTMTNGPRLGLRGSVTVNALSSHQILNSLTPYSLNSGHRYSHFIQALARLRMH
jgi:hypothetical protein